MSETNQLLNTLIQSIDATNKSVETTNDAVKDLTKSVEELVVSNAVRVEADKHLEKEHKKFNDFIEENKAPLTRLIKWQNWMDDFIGKKVLPITIGFLFLAILSAAGYGIIGK